ncbi:MAG: dipeptidase [Acidobacteria bacterium]|jgi:membrane dipeptidase|nr:dipeptidase [Acidobacteriota bacterium]
MKIDRLTVLSLLITIIIAPFLLPGADDAADEALVAKALLWHERALTVDTHCDTPFKLLEKGWDIGQYHKTGERGSGCQDLPRMKEGGLDASFFAVFVGQGPRTPEGHARAKEKAVATLDAMDAMYRKYPDLCGLALTPADARRLEKEGKRAIFIGMENGYPLGQDPALIDYFYKRGVRYVTLAHTADNDICDSSTDRKDPEDRGLSEWGRQVVRRLNDLGVMVDVSHISDRSFSEVLALSRAPVIASHSCARALSASPRNLSDDMLLALKRNGGVIQLCILDDYIKQPPANPERDRAFAELWQRIDETYGGWGGIKDKAVRDKVEAEYDALGARYPNPPVYVKDAVDHIDHIVRLIGIEHVGIGTDFDGGGGLADCRDVTELKNITIELVRRGYDEDAVAKIWGGNAMRVMQKVMDLAKK